MNFQKRYDEIKQQSFELVYNEAHPFVFKHWKEVKDWSKLWFNYYDPGKELYLKYGPIRKFPIPQMEAQTNKDRTLIKTFSIGFEEDSEMAESLTINGLKFHFLSEDLIITIADYIENNR